MFLEHMSDDEKFNLTSKLCLEVLGGVVEGKMALQQAQHVLSDALSILTSKEIKLGATTAKDEDIDEDENPEAQKLADAKGKILSKLVKKNVMENIVPIVLELKQLLETNRSPLLGNLIEYLKELMKEYKDEVEEILVDKKLIKELEYELRQFKPQTVNTFKSPAPPSATKQMPMASPRPVIAASPAKGRPSLANFAVPKLRKRVSLALTSYTPSPARKNVSDVRRALLEEDKPESVEKDGETENKSEEPVFRMPTTPFRGGAQSADLRMPPLPSPGRRDWPTLRRPRNTSSPTKEDSRPQPEETSEEPKMTVKRQGTKRKAPEAPSSPQAPVSPVRKRSARGAATESTSNTRKRKRETAVKETTAAKKNTRKKVEESDEEISDVSSDEDEVVNDKAVSDDEISDVSSDEEEKENKTNVNKTKTRSAPAKTKAPVKAAAPKAKAPARRSTRKVRDD